MWQSLTEELKGTDFVIVAVAQDTAQAARPWVEAAKATYPVLIDHDHHVSDLYNLVNVPQAVWIDETGRIVRAPEAAGSNDAFRSMDRTKFTLPEDVAAERVRVKNAYLDAVRDWARHGAASRFVMDATKARARTDLPTPQVVQAHTLFRLGQALLARGKGDEAQRVFERATTLHPESWSLYRRTAPKDTRGLATGEHFWARVDALGDRPYYKPVALDD